MVNHINDNDYGHILTSRTDRVRARVEEVPDQPARGRAATLSFANALRSALREDPDVILVGEMRDLETSASPSPARDGHLVFAPCTRAPRPRPSTGSSTCSAAEKEMVRRSVGELARGHLADADEDKDGGGASRRTRS